MFEEDLVFKVTGIITDLEENSIDQIIDVLLVEEDFKETVKDAYELIQVWWELYVFFFGIKQDEFYKFFHRKLLFEI